MHLILLLLLLQCNLLRVQLRLIQQTLHHQRVRLLRKNDIHLHLLHHQFLHLH